MVSSQVHDQHGWSWSLIEVHRVSVNLSSSIRSSLTTKILVPAGPTAFLLLRLLETKCDSSRYLTRSGFVWRINDAWLMYRQMLTTVNFFWITSIPSNLRNNGHKLGLLIGERWVFSNSTANSSGVIWGKTSSQPRSEVDHSIHVNIPRPSCRAPFSLQTKQFPQWEPFQVE